MYSTNGKNLGQKGEPDITQVVNTLTCCRDESGSFRHDIKSRTSGWQQPNGEGLLPWIIVSNTWCVQTIENPSYVAT